MPINYDPHSTSNPPRQTLEELTSESEGSGLESERHDAPPLNDLPFDPSSLQIETRTMTVHEVLALLKSGLLLLQPDFRRRALWDNRRQSKLIESFLLRLPIPSLYFSENDNGSYSVVHGVQRLTAIARFVSCDLLANQSGAGNVQPLLLEQLEYMQVHEGCPFTALPFGLQRRILETPLVMHVVRRGTPEIIKFNIFERFNTGGLPLSAQEMRSVLIGGRASEALTKLALSAEFQSATRSGISPERLGDHELILRYFAFNGLWPWENFEHSGVDAICRQTMHAMNRWSDSRLELESEQFRLSMERCIQLFGEFAFRKISVDRRMHPINKAMFEIQAVMCRHIPADSLGDLRRFREAFAEKIAETLDNDVAFFQSISHRTGEAKSVNTRFSTMHRIFDEMDLLERRR
jgi:hypothetical protein